MKLNVLIVFVMVLSSCLVSKITNTQIERIEFKGTVLAIPQNGDINIAKPLTAIITIMKTDSTVIKNIVTDNNGDFLDSINIDKKLNPYIVKIKAIKNIQVDTLFQNTNMFMLYCVGMNDLIEEVYFDSDTEMNFKYECKGRKETKID